jgi:predicted NodU family carbamoyl transferase/ferredoxin/MoaA/NifB/PqqE/SkfB family radical SAM enzyme
MLAAPVTDAFGTRLSPEALVAGLDANGLPGAQLAWGDDGVLVRHELDEHGVGFATGLTWLKSVLSPLVPLRLERGGERTPRFVDARKRPPTVVALAEIFDPSTLPAAVAHVLAKLNLEKGSAEKQVVPPPLPDPEWTAIANGTAETFTAALRTQGLASGGATLTVLAETKDGPRLVGPLAMASALAGPHLLVWRRRGGAQGIRPAVLLAASTDAAAIRAFSTALGDRPRERLGDGILVDGLVWSIGRRPTVAAPRTPETQTIAIAVDPSRCTSCGLCADVCPTNYLDRSGHATTSDESRCIRCYDCVEACPQDALRPTEAPDTAALARAIDDRDGWLSRLRGAPGPSVPAPFPPSYLLPKQAKTKPRYVLGLAISTMQEHAAALVKDGVLVGAIEEERLNRIRHYGWKVPGREGVTICIDPRIALEEAICRRSVRVLLEEAGITLDDVDVVALNGIPAKYRRSYSLVDATKPLATLRAGRVLALPHHLTHASSAFRASGFDSAWIFTVDGRGDRETASLFRAENGQIAKVFDLLSLTNRSIGGTYETATRLLGLGGHGQGSLMALAAFGHPTIDVSPYLSVRSLADVSIDEQGPAHAFAHLRREYDDPISQEQKDFASSIQAALEQSVTQLLRSGGLPQNADALCLGGGVTLNCKMNGELRRAFEPVKVFAQPGANDGGTAIGAALEGWVQATGETKFPPMSHAYLGPAFDDAEIESALVRSGFAYRKLEAIENEVADRLARGEVVGWFQGRMEFGPRALGARSILADPRGTEVKDRVNRIKDRQDWRPFAPSLLAGHEDAWLENAFDSRFMLVAAQVRPEKRALVPAIVHADGSTRPQVVHAETHPRYHALLTAFHERTGVPMVVNTSFNRRGEPIVCTPQDALEAFGELALDALAIGSFLVEKRPVSKPILTPDAELAALPTGRRLLLRLTVESDWNAEHCTLQDLKGLRDRTFEEALDALAAGRRAGCSELVILRGEAATRPDLPSLIVRARRMGYRFVQLQTSGRPLAQPQRRDALISAGIDSFEVTLLAAVTALQALARSGRDVLVTVPLLRRNLAGLGRVVGLVQKLGVKRIQFNFPRPVELAREVKTSPLPRLELAAEYARRAMRLATEHGLTATSEGLPLCHLDPTARHVPDAAEDWRRHRIDDLHLLHESAEAVRRQMRPHAPPCRSCSAREACPKTWALYQELFGTAELRPLGVVPR